jgi:hypothetical protein
VGGSGRDHRVGTAVVVVVSVKRKLVGGHGVAGHGVDDVSELTVLAGRRGSTASVDWVVLGGVGDIVNTSATLGRVAGGGGGGAGGGVRRRAAGGSGRGDFVVENVKGQFTGRLVAVGAVWVVRLKVAIEDVL